MKYTVSVRKKQSSSVDFGIAIAYKNDKFTICESDEFSFIDLGKQYCADFAKDNWVQFCLLKVNDSERYLVVVNTHL